MIIIRLLKYLPNLTYLNLWKNTNITDKGLKRLRKLKKYNHKKKLIKN